MNRIATRSLLAGMLLLGSLGISPSAPVAAECIGAWTAMPSFTAVARTAERIVVGKVVEDLDLMPGEEGGVTSSFVLDVEEVLRGPDTTGPMTVDDHRTGARRTGKCGGTPLIWVREGDRVAIAFEGRLPGSERRGSAVAWIEGRPDALAASEGEMLSLARVQRIAGSGPSGHPVIAPVVTCPARPIAPLDTAPAPAALASPALSIAPADATVPMASIAPASAARPVGRWNGTWSRMPDAPIAPRIGAATDYAVGEDRIYVWGGRGADGELLADGAWFDVIEGRWHRLPDAGLVARERFGFDSDGHGLTIWGGVDASGAPLDDGARLLLRSRERRPVWRPLPPAPLTPGPASISGDRNITLVVTPGAAATDPARWAVLDDDTGRLGWDEPSDPDIRVHGAMPAPSLPPGIGYEFASAREAALLVGHQADGTAVVSWFTGMWPGEWSDPVRIPLPADGSCPAIDLPSFGWIGVGADGQPAGLITDAWGGDEWQALPTPPRAAATGGMLVWAPGHLIAADGLVAWDIARQRWVRLPPPPGGPRTGVSAAWFDGRLYLWGGASADGRLARSGWIFTPDLPPDTVRLPGGNRDGYGDCGGVGNPVNAVMHADRTDPRLVWFTLGRSVYSTTWPDGFVADFSGSRGRVLGPDGRVVARDGDRLRDLDIGWCPGFDVIGF